MAVIDPVLVVGLWAQECLVAPEPPPGAALDPYINGPRHAQTSGNVIDAACATADPGVMSRRMGECRMSHEPFVRHLSKFPIQGVIGGRVLARETTLCCVTT